MKTFREFLKEKNLTFNDAQKIFGITHSISNEELKKKYKELAIKNHPDKGGSVEKMQDINQAYELLSKNNVRYGRAPGWQPPDPEQQQKEWEQVKKDREKKKEEFAEYIIPLVKKYNKPEAFLKYLEEIFEQKFTETTTYGADRGPYNTGSVWFKTIYVSQDREHFVTIQTDFNRISSGSGLTQSDADFNFYMNVLILSGTKKIKLAKRTFASKNDISELGKPEVVLPKSKFVKQLAKKETKKFSKKDAALLLKNKLDARISDNRDAIFFYIPLSKEASETTSGYVKEKQMLVLVRTVSMGRGHYRSNGFDGSDFKIDRNTKIAGSNPSCWFLESEENLVKFVQLVQKYQYKGHSAQELIKKMTPDLENLKPKY